MNLGIYQAIGFVLTLIMVAIIAFLIWTAIPHDSMADFRSIGERFG